PLAWDALEELHVHLQAMARLLLLVALPALLVLAVLLARGQPVHPVAPEDAVHRRGRDGHAVVALQVVGNPAGAEVVVLAEVEDLADHLAGRPTRWAMRPPRPVAQASGSVGLEASLPLVERLSRDAEVTARPGDVLGAARVLENLEPPVHQARLLVLRHVPP